MKPLRILIAEDNDADVNLVEEALSHHQIDHELRIVSDGAAALEFIAKMGADAEAPCPDLVLLDLNLPKADGITVLREFRHHPECNDCPVIVLTSSGAERDRAIAAELGVARYFRKPSDFDAFLELGAIVREVVDSNR